MTSAASRGAILPIGSVPDRRIGGSGRALGISCHPEVAPVSDREVRCDDVRARRLDVEAGVGVKIGWVIWVGFGLLAVGFVMLAGAVIVILLISRRASAAGG